MTATTSGDGGPLDAEVHLASFACNVMVDAIRDSLLALFEVNVALLKMIGAIESGIGGAPERRGIVEDPLGMLGGLDEVKEPRSEIRRATEVAPHVRATEAAHLAPPVWLETKVMACSHQRTVALPSNAPQKIVLLLVESGWLIILRVHQQPPPWSPFVAITDSSTRSR